MKYFIFFIISLALIGFVTFFALSTNPTKNNSSKTPSKQTTNFESDTFGQVIYESNTYSYSGAPITNPKNLKLIPNYSEQQSSTNIIDQNNCQFLTNAGFYSKTNQPIGWFTTDSNTISQVQSNRLFNGFLYLEEGKVNISDTAPVTSVTFGLQTGPILIQNNQALNLTISNDSPRRRAFAALTKKNQLQFFIVFNKNSLFEGPKLSDLPEIAEKIGFKLGDTFTTAINLDGGTASTYYDGEIHLQEAQPVGSFFCLQ